MKALYFFDDKIKAHFMKGKKYCNPASTGQLSDHLFCIRENDVNVWFYSKDGETIAIDSGHFNFRSAKKKIERIGIDPDGINHIFITHADVDHCGGIDRDGENIFPNAQVYIGEKEERYLNKSLYRFKRAGVKIYNCVKLEDGYKKLYDGDIINIGNITVTALHIPGHTLGHMCYVIDDEVLFSGDCLAINDTGGYSFFEFFTQYPEENKASLVKLKRYVEKSNIHCICTGHSGVRYDIDNAFLHIRESAAASLNHPFDATAPDDFREDAL